MLQYSVILLHCGVFMLVACDFNFGSVSFNFIYIAPKYNNSCIEALYIVG